MSMRHMLRNTPPESEQPLFDRFSAIDYIAAHDNDVKALHRKAIPTLRDLHAAELKAQRITIVMGGPRTRDEYVNAILEMRYPLLREAQAVRYAPESTS